MTKPASILSRLAKNMHKRDADPLSHLVDEYYLRRDAAPNRLTEYTISMRKRLRPGGRFSPSSLCGCRRQAAFKFVGMEGAMHIVDPEKLAIFEHGDWVHHKWQATFLDMEQVLGREEIKVRSVEGKVIIPELYIAGNSDADLRLEDERNFIVDVKSINDRGFSYLFTTDEPIPEHVRQLTTYCKGKGRKYGLLWYENKNNQQTRAFVIRAENALWAEVMEWTEDVADMLDREQLPPMHPDCQQGNFLFDRCPYSGVCFSTKATPVRIQRRMYKNFEGVEAAWKEGNRAIEASEV